ncbi:MAG: DUF1738 domain-containing protein [Clostridia bacterium]|nr:DUF1738 domain-containing protein [Clostridia bacterium]
MAFDLYQQITDRIIAELEKGRIPWHKPWKCCSGAVSRATGKPYSVLNQLMLPKPGEYVTFNQAIEEGHPVKKGEKASMVFFFKFIDGEDKDTGKPKKIPLLKYYSVFHISQCDGMKPRFTVSDFPSNLEPDDRAEKILADYVKRSGVTLRMEQSDCAFYRPSTDTIVIPDLGQFVDVAEYYSTLFHETIHSTGHPSRLNRITDIAMFGSENYSKEELVAELGASYLVNTVGLKTPSSFGNSAGYIQGWLSALKNDKRFIVSAAGKAEKAVQMILGENEKQDEHSL